MSASWTICAVRSRRNETTQRDLPVDAAPVVRVGAGHARDRSTVMLWMGRPPPSWQVRPASSSR
jgi:hypothetical protein